MRPRTADLEVIWEIFHHREYELTKQLRFSTVLDCGANAGYFAAYAPLMAGSRLEVYVGVEPNADSFSLLEEQVALQDPARSVALYNLAVSNRDGVIRFRTSEDSRGHRIAEDGDVEMPTLTISTILNRSGIDVVDLLKVDIEGGEKLLLESIESWRDRVKSLVVELHDGLSYDWFAALVRGAGFTPVPEGALFRACLGAVRDDVPMPAGLSRM
jgi:FkbM family methyltransferase